MTTEELIQDFDAENIEKESIFRGKSIVQMYPKGLPEDEYPDMDKETKGYWEYGYQIALSDIVDFLRLRNIPEPWDEDADKCIANHQRAWRGPFPRFSDYEKPSLSLDEIIHLIDDRAQRMREWLKEEYPEGHPGCDYLDHGTDEKAHWHYGRYAAHRDVSKLLRRYLPIGENLSFI